MWVTFTKPKMVVPPSVVVPPPLPKNFWLSKTRRPYRISPPPRQFLSQKHHQRASETIFFLRRFHSPRKWKPSVFSRFSPKMRFNPFWPRDLRLTPFCPRSLLFPGTPVPPPPRKENLFPARGQTSANFWLNRLPDLVVGFKGRSGPLAQCLHFLGDLTASVFFQQHQRDCRTK